MNKRLEMMIFVALLTATMAHAASTIDGADKYAYCCSAVKTLEAVCLGSG